ncbi:hypothetical protein MSAN_02284400 [Mycena sanguinolenta]|uniref:Uncharacterized protein n=1 Tax=Mycena sanguinolenta TaxID=230812 RepID=A0A8H6X981_9AGAR|nr:hypothetical protein MSAN_02284400 [Mycena sanguinolenta]
MPLVRVRSRDVQAPAVTNFQDISALLSLLAADTVERKLFSETNFDWERMSSVWSVFGMVGALRANLKIAASLSGSERAGLDLVGAAGYTAERTANSSCYWSVGSPNKPLKWRDSTNQVLSRLDSASLPWIHPISIAIGYSRCPWNIHTSRCIKEILAPAVWTIITVVFSTFPALLLIPSLQNMDPIHICLCSLQILTGLFAGSLTPLLLHRSNSYGLPALVDINPLRATKNELIRDGDHVVTTAYSNRSHIIWQTPLSAGAPSSGDLWYVRLMCLLDAGIILGAYLLNYIALGTATTIRQYLWLTTQLIILMLRFVLWARRPVWYPHRPPCLLAVACGSLGPALAATPVETGSKLGHAVVEFAIASALSRQTNRGAFVGQLNRGALLQLIGAPADIIHANYTKIGDHFQPTLKEKIVVVRLSWSFVEQLYIGQGVILGNNPWAIGGMCLGAVLSGGCFLGLTTVHPYPSHLAKCQRKRCRLNLDARKTNVITQDGYLVSNDVFGEVIQPLHPVDIEFLDRHAKFRANIRNCRATSKSNGPSHVEIRVCSFGPVVERRTQITITEPNLNLDFVRSAVADASGKSHENCGPWVCGIEAFGSQDLHIRKPKTTRKAKII